MTLSRKKRILFVDDEPLLLQSLRRMLYSKRDVWDVAFASDGPSALEILDKGSFDVILSDMRMPGMNGAQLLEAVRKRHPQLTRIILSGQSDMKGAMASVPVAHQFLAKPCQPEELASAIDQAFALDELLASSSLKQIISQIDSLPSLPSLYLELREEVASEDSSIDRVGKIIAQDVGMTAKVLQLVNSAFFGLPQKISSPVQAVLFLGLKTLEALLLSIHIFSQFKHQNRFGAFIHQLWDHSLSVSTMARAIAMEEKRDRTLADNAALAGMLHDCGKLILADTFPAEYEELLADVAKGDITAWQAEEKFFSTSHGVVGAYLMNLWGLPKTISETLAFSHIPALSHQRHFTPLTAVHAGDALVLWGVEKPGDALCPYMDYAYLASLRIEDRVPAWREVYLQKKKGD